MTKIICKPLTTPYERKYRDFNANIPHQINCTYIQEMLSPLRKNDFIKNCCRYPIQTGVERTGDLLKSFTVSFPFKGTFALNMVITTDQENVVWSSEKCNLQNNITIPVNINLLSTALEYLHLEICTEDENPIVDLRQIQPQVTSHYVSFHDPSYKFQMTQQYGEFSAAAYSFNGNKKINRQWWKWDFDALDIVHNTYHCIHPTENNYLAHPFNI